MATRPHSTATVAAAAVMTRDTAMLGVSAQDEQEHVGYWLGALGPCAGLNAAHSLLGFNA